MSKKNKESLLELVQAGQVVLIDKKEIGVLRRAGNVAVDTLDSYKRRFSNHKDLVFECCCEGEPPSCSYIHSVDPERSARTPNFCPLDGRGCRWVKVKKKKFTEPKSSS